MPTGHLTTPTTCSLDFLFDHSQTAPRAQTMLTIPSTNSLIKFPRQVSSADSLIQFPQLVASVGSLDIFKRDLKKSFPPTMESGTPFIHQETLTTVRMHQAHTQC